MSTTLSDFINSRFHNQVKARIVLEAQTGNSRSFPPALLPQITQVLEKEGITSLYSHQYEAFDAISQGQDTVIVSQTASGKTLSFLLPIINEYIKADNKFSVMLLYPTKALSRDQEGTLGELMKQSLNATNMGTFDGDTPREERSKLQKSADFIITNPDMLHSGILPNHNRNWKNYLSRLRYIVVDEVHCYRGSFGSHVSNVFRRLLRVCDLHGTHPSFVCSSATVGNPGAHVQRLFHRPFTIIDKDGSPRPRREMFFINPPQQVSQGGALYRKGTGSVSVHLMREAMKRGIRTICFCRARQQVERLYRAVCDNYPDLSRVIKPYRGGLLPNERRALERGLFKGDIKGIISTNALELGIDIGDLELCIISGHPGTIASFWQQAGRVGRKSNGAVIVYIAKDSPVDQYLVNHPEFVTKAPIEEAWLNADNAYIILQHLPCAAWEHPLRPREPMFDSRVYEQTLEILKEDKTLTPYKGFYRYALSDYAARGVNLRGMTDYNVEIYCGSEVIGELDPIGARGTLYKDAIYQHLGRKYMSMDLDLEKKLCRVEPVEVDYYTEAVWEKRISLTEEEDRKEVQGHQLIFGFINVNKQPKLYKKIRERSLENIGYGPITLPCFEYDTTGFCLLPGKSWKQALDAKDKRYAGAAMYGLSYILKRVAPSLCMGDRDDIETDVSLAEENREIWKSAFYLYDSIEGGVGYGEKIYELLTESFTLCRDIITECECKTGCPSCVPPLPPGVENEELAELLVESNAALECTKSLLTSLLTSKVELPEVKIFKQLIPFTGPEPKVDKEAIALKNRLKKASGILKKKREREH